MLSFFKVVLSFFKKFIPDVIMIVLYIIAFVYFLFTCPVSVSDLIYPPNISNSILEWLHILAFVGTFMIPVAFIGAHMKLLWFLHSKSDNDDSDK